MEFLCSLRAAIDAVTDDTLTRANFVARSLLPTLIACSNASFNHQSMSFKAEGQAIFLFGHDFGVAFAEDVRFFLNGAEDNPEGGAHVLLGDSRDSAAVIKGQVDCVITSPPYANRMSYIRELWLYMIG